MSEEQTDISQPGKPPRTDLPAGVKVLLRILSILLCLCLCASLLATALILDFRLATSKDNIKELAGSLLRSPASPQRVPLTAAMGGLRLAGTSGAGTQTQEALVEWLYDTLKEQHGDELTVTQEQMQAFLDQSTTKEYLTDKIASYMDDFINGTANTTITTQELAWLIQENNAAIEAELGVEMDEAAQEQVLAFVEEVNIGEVIRTEVIENMNRIPISGSASAQPGHTAASGYTVGDLMQELRTLTSTAALIISIAINILLIAALFFTNRMRLSATLCCTGIPMTVVGTLLALPTALLQLIPSLLPNPLGSAVSILAGTVAPVHYSALGLGIAALVGAIVAKALRKK